MDAYLELLAKVDATTIGLLLSIKSHGWSRERWGDSANFGLLHKKSDRFETAEFKRKASVLALALALTQAITPCH